MSTIIPDHKYHDRWIIDEEITNAIKNGDGNAIGTYTNLNRITTTTWKFNHQGVRRWHPLFDKVSRLRCVIIWYSRCDHVRGYNGDGFALPFLFSYWICQRWKKCQQRPRVMNLSETDEVSTSSTGSAVRRRWRHLFDKYHDCNVIRLIHAYAARRVRGFPCITPTCWYLQ